MDRYNDLKCCGNCLFYNHDEIDINKGINIFYNCMKRKHIVDGKGICNKWKNDNYCILKRENLNEYYFENKIRRSIYD